MKHIWNAIDLCHRKLLNEQHRIQETHTEELNIGQISRPSMAVAVDQRSERLDEVDANLRCVTAARREYRKLYGELGD